MYEIPTSIELNNREFGIRNNGDYRVILDCFSALSDLELTKQERLFASLIIFYEDLNEIDDVSMLGDLQIAVQEMYKFFNCGVEDTGKSQKHKLIDWEQDAPLIFSAINNVAAKEVRSEPYIHWWTFMGYYSAIKDCPLTTIVGIRDKIVKQKKLEKHEREFKNENPQYFVWNSKTVESNEADELAKALWNSED